MSKKIVSWSNFFPIRLLITFLILAIILMVIILGGFFLAGLGAILGAIGAFIYGIIKAIALLFRRKKKKSDEGNWGFLISWRNTQESENKKATLKTDSCNAFSLGNSFNYFNRSRCTIWLEFFSDMSPYLWGVPCYNACDFHFSSRIRMGFWPWQRNTTEGKELIKIIKFRCYKNTLRIIGHLGCNWTFFHKK